MEVANYNRSLVFIIERWILDDFFFRAFEFLC